MKALIAILIVVSSILVTGVIFSQAKHATAGNSSNTAPITNFKATETNSTSTIMTTSQILAIGSPAVGMMVFNKDTDSFWVFTGKQWNNLVLKLSSDEQKYSSGIYAVNYHLQKR